MDVLQRRASVFLRKQKQDWAEIRMIRQFAKPTDGPQSGAREAQIMIGHPNLIPACG